MVVKIPTFTNTETAQLSRTPAGKVANIKTGLNVGKDIKAVGKALNVLDMSNEMSDEAFAAEEFNKYKEDISATKAQLMLKQGVEAENLSDQYNLSSDALTEGIEFPNERARKAFFNKVKVTSSVDRGQLNMQQVKEGISSNIRQQGVVQDNALNDMIGAASRNDHDAIIAATVMYAEAGNSMMQGQDESVRVAKNAEGISAGLNKQLLRRANFNPTSAVEESKKLKDMGLMNENDFQIVASVARSGYVKGVAGAKLQEITEDPKNNFKTAYEVVGAGSKTFITNIPLSFKDKQARIQKDISKKVSVSSDIYGNISDEVTADLNSSGIQYAKQAGIQYNEFMEDTTGRILDTAIAIEGQPEGADKNALKAQLSIDYATLRENGEFTLAKEMEDKLFKTIDSKSGALSDALARANRGMSQTELVSEYMGKLSKQDFNTVKGRITSKTNSVDSEREENAINMLMKSTGFEGAKKSTVEETRGFLEVKDKMLRIYNDAYDFENKKHKGDIPSDVMSSIYRHSVTNATKLPPMIEANLDRVVVGMETVQDDSFITAYFDEDRKEKVALEISNRVYNKLKESGKPFTEDEYKANLIAEILVGE